MTEPANTRDEWDFYPCRVDDAPASIFLNLGLAGTEQRPVEADTLYWVRIEMGDPGSHGMGTESEANAMFPVEDEITARAQDVGLVYVGRLRNHATWQLTFYGPDGRVELLRASMTPSGIGASRQVEVGCKSDPRWTYYEEFLMPDAERLQWMQDRRLVDVLREHGDPLIPPREVAHWAYFDTRQARDRFLSDVMALGFTTTDVAMDPEPDTLQFCAHVRRVDSVELDHIHAVVMQLFEAARRHGGEYDGWETPLERGSP